MMRHTIGLVVRVALDALDGHASALVREAGQELGRAVGRAVIHKPEVIETEPQIMATQER